MKRMTIDLEEDIHRKLKLRAVESGESIRDMVVATIRQLLGLPPAPPKSDRKRK